MSAELLNQITRALVEAMTSGASTLGTYSVPLLAALSVFAFYTQFAPVVMSGGHLGDALGELLWICLKLGFFLWLMVNLVPLTTAAYQTFLQWGIRPTNGQFSHESFFQPSTVVDLGFVLAGDINAVAQRLSLFQRATNLWLGMGYSVAYWCIIFSFFAIALHLMMTIIEFHLSVLVATVLIPWGVFHPTAFFSEFSVGWITGGLVRVLIIGALVGIGTPLFDGLRPTMTAGGDPTKYSTEVLAGASVIFAILAWVVPGRAAAIAGRGVSMALHGGTVMAAAAGAGRMLMLGSHVVRGVSGMIPPMPAPTKARP